MFEERLAANQGSAHAEVYFLNEVTSFGHEKSEASVWVQTDITTRDDILWEVLLLSNFCVRQVYNFGPPTRDPWGELINRTLKKPAAIIDLKADQPDDQSVQWHSDVFPPIALTQAHIPVCDSGIVRVITDPDQQVKRRFVVDVELVRSSNEPESAISDIQSLCTIRLKGFGFLQRKAASHAHLAVNHFAAALIGRRPNDPSYAELIREVMKKCAEPLVWMSGDQRRWGAEIALEAFDQFTS